MTVSSTAAPAATVLQWHDDLMLGVADIDHNHREFVQVVQGLQLAEDGKLLDLFPGLVTHLEAHFGFENRVMQETEFPPRDCHIDEHAAVLKSVHEVHELLQNDAARGAQVCRDLLQALVDWFPAHTQQLDSALSHWLAKKTWGAKPVLIKRGLALR